MHGVVRVRKHVCDPLDPSEHQARNLLQLPSLLYGAAEICGYGGSRRALPKRFAKTGGETIKAKKTHVMAKGQKTTIQKKKMKILSTAPVKAKPGTTSAPKGAPKSAPTKTH